MNAPISGSTSSSDGRDFIFLLCGEQSTYPKASGDVLQVSRPGEGTGEYLGPVVEE